MFKLKRKKHLLGKKGVTLVECIVAVAMLAIIGLMAYTMFSTGFTNIQRGNEDLKSASDATVVLIAPDKPENASIVSAEAGTITIEGVSIPGTYYTYTDAHGNEYVTFVPDEE